MKAKEAIGRPAVFAFLVVSAAVAVLSCSGAAANDRSERALAGMSQPLSTLLPRIEANVGQADARADFIFRGREYAALIAADRVAIGLNSASEQHSALRDGKTEWQDAPATRSVFTMQFVGADPHAAKSGIDPLVSTANYLLGNRPRDWRTGVLAYQAVKYAGVYPGIDVIYHHRDARFEYDLVVHPGAKPDAVAIEFPGVARLDVDTDGDLVLSDAAGVVTKINKPHTFQEVAGARRPIESEYKIDGQQVRIVLGAYDKSAALVIDPALDYRNVLGGSRSTAAWAIAVDAQGNAYITGDTASVDFPLAGPFQREQRGSTDAFVAKIRPDGSIAYSTYLGGSSADVGYAIAVDAEGNAYVTGDTRSTDFPVLDPVQATLKGAADVFIAKLSPDGSKLLYSTYVGGSKGERGQGIAVDRAGNAVVVGYTQSENFPTVEALQKKFAGGNADAFVLKLNASGSAFVFSTYLGGGNDRPDIATAVALDKQGNAYVTGFTNSLDFPVLGVVQPFIGPTDAFVSKLDPAGNLIYSTHIGGEADDEAMGIAVDDEGSAYITGQTESVDFPVTKGAFNAKCQPVKVPLFNGQICSGGDAFVVKLTPMGNRIEYSTFLNGKGFEVGRTIVVDRARNAYVAGITTSPDFATVDAIQPAFGGGYDVFVVKLDPTGAKALFSTYLGGSKDDGAYGIGVDNAGNAYVAGYTMSPDFLGQRNALPVSDAPPLRRTFVIKIGESVKPTAKK